MLDRHRQKLSNLNIKQYVPVRAARPSKPPSYEFIQPQEEGKIGVVFNNQKVYYSAPSFSRVSDPKLGLVIGTYGTAPFVHLQLETARRLYPNIPILIHDDNSPNQNQLIQLCNTYKCELTTTFDKELKTSFGWCVGDISVFIAGLLWAKGKEIDVITKFSRRFIPLINPFDELKKLVINTQHSTYNNVCNSAGYGFRTECAAMRVEDWLRAHAHECIMTKIRHEVKSKPIFYVEPFIHHIAEYVGLFHNHRETHATWNFMGTDRKRCGNYLWHQKDRPENYQKRAAELGLTYSPEAFRA